MFVIAGPISALIVTLHWIRQEEAIREIRADVLSKGEGLIDVLERDLERIVLLGDSEAGVGVADRLRSLPQVRRLVIHDDVGVPVLAYRRQDLPEQQVDGSRPSGAEFGTEEVVVSKPLKNQHGRFAQALLTLDASELRAKMREARESALWTLALYITLGLVVSHVLQGIVARPIIALSRFVRDVAASGDYSRRVRLDDSSELGVLGDGVDGLLVQINKHERSLTAALEDARTANHALSEEMNARVRMEIELRQAQKLEAVGRLAAGIAHEINTPVQFTNDSVIFAKDAIVDLTALIQKYQVLTRSVLDEVPSLALATSVLAAEEDTDMAYLLENLPIALDRATEGLGRVATIVRSMKEFAHPDQKEMTPVDLNQAILSTLTVARTEYKYVADVVTDLGELPPVTCHAGDINQVVLNLVVNAAHAIADVVGEGGERGRLSVRTGWEGDQVVIEIQDTGAGIPPEIRDRIFDPFFTTKEVGKGTGQGLAIARQVVIDRHGGSITFETTVGMGTTFFVRLPIDGKSAGAAVAAA